MKRDRKLIRSILKRIEAADHEQIIFESRYPTGQGDSNVRNPGWSRDEIYNIGLLVDEGCLKQELVSGQDWQEDGVVDIYIALTGPGHDLLERPGLLARIFMNIWSNMATVIAAVVFAWLPFLFGPELGIIELLYKIFE